jgi:hypothetical protein
MVHRNMLKSGSQSPTISWRLVEKGVEAKVTGNKVPKRGFEEQVSPDPD